ncbi:DUF4249 domain-containing protein [Rubrivirga marina]|uniref:DUF4249 domain-containing protein n=1 Tax=Rubrivirga marina TaxID=1196024 RepID=A0A271IXI1_9BACT|nr:DUF4249 domain-containing protein [Rubrivirga marina]PAP75239.1 hypothetical protein BSZ37_01675 [Rubrivirga marina]
MRATSCAGSPRLGAEAGGVALLFALFAVAGCDFTPALDIETPPYEAGLVVRSVLVADSVALVRVGESWDPYEGRDLRNYQYGSSQQASGDAVVTLFRDGQFVERLALRPDSCEAYGLPPDPETGFAPTFPCGPYAGTVPIEAGATYTIRAEAEGLPPAEGTVTVPRRPTLAVVEEPTAPNADRRLRVTIGDPGGPGDLYGLSLLRSTVSTRSTTCVNGVCTDSTYVIRRDSRALTSFDTSDPVVLAAAREVANSGISIATFPDETFDGRSKSFVITPSSNYAQEDTDGALVVQLAALSGDVYDIYQIVSFSGGGDNPFAEPINLPSNVEGGYGLVGALALAEVALPPRAAGRE